MGIKHEEVWCPYCNRYEIHHLPEEARNVRNPHIDDKGWPFPGPISPFNRPGSFWRRCKEAELTCTETGKKFHVDYD